jgi:outer membrane murein-binding lipoprotein Lpp
MLIDEKIFAVLSIMTDVQNKLLTGQGETKDGVHKLSSDVQDIRTEMLQLRAEVQQLHHDLVRIAEILTQQNQH